MMRFMVFSEKLSLLLDRQGLLAADLARELGTAASTVSNWLNGRGSLPRPSNLLKIARFLDVPVEYLADDDATAPRPGLTEQQQRILWLAEIVGYDDAIHRLTASTAAPRTPAVVKSEAPVQEPVPAAIARGIRRRDPNRKEG